MTNTRPDRDEQQGVSKLAGLSRRGVLRLGAGVFGAVGAASLAPLARAATTRPKPLPWVGPRLVIVNLKGGNDGLNTIVPVDLQSYHDQRPTLALTSGQTLSMNTGPGASLQYRMNPQLAALQAAFTSGDLAVFQKVGYPGSNESHFESESIYSRARRDISTGTGVDTSGWLARLTDTIGPSPTSAIAVGMGHPEDFRGSSSPLLSIGSSLSSFEYGVDWPHGNTNDPHRKATVKAILDQFQGSSALADSVRDMQAVSNDLVDSIGDAEATYASTVAYPENNAIATQLQTIAKLIQGGFETNVFCIAKGRFDTHAAQGPLHAELLGLLDGALGAFSEDLMEMGAWNDTIVLVVTEFGRRSFENGSFGTDHGAANTMLALGGSVVGGVYGEALNDTDLTATESLTYALDFRSIYKEIVRDHFGVGSQGLGTIFPEPLEIETELGFL
ncbi:MAG: hypothetical protein CMJ84_01695 [Planctomycetes bacterium]|jgi:uncharacterized protein (DUF1501 family)|nr:hypothetical protein [Planctomycetota bacterium]MDP6410142.1 DUF1501 domain-containing protein [Planctomycetota bacterium]